MMELRLENKGNISVLYLDKLNLILGNNQSGKTQKLKQLESIFNGNSNYALLNGVEVSNGLFNVIHIAENRDLESEIGIKSKSSFHTNIIKPFVNDEYEEIKKYVNDFATNIENMFNRSDKMNFSYSLSENNVQLNSKKVEKLETIIFELFSDIKHSKGSMEEFYFYQSLLQLKEGVNNIILIDDVDRYLDNKVLYEFIENIMQNDNLTIILTSKNKYILDTLNVTKYIDSDFNTIELLPIAKQEFYSEFHKIEKSNISLDNYIMQSENFYSKSDYKNYLNKHMLEILKKIEL